MVKVQKMDRSNTAPSSKTFRDEFNGFVNIQINGSGIFKDAVSSEEVT
jgi:hypothetical protein